MELAPLSFRGGVAAKALAFRWRRAPPQKTKTCGRLRTPPHPSMADAADRGRPEEGVARNVAEPDALQRMRNSLDKQPALV